MPAQRHHDSEVAVVLHQIKWDNRIVAEEVHNFFEADAVVAVLDFQTPVISIQIGMDHQCMVATHTWDLVINKVAINKMHHFIRYISINSRKKIIEFILKWNLIESFQRNNFNQVELWVETKTDEGKSYYYNAITRETTWTRPEGQFVKIMGQNEVEAMQAAKMQQQNQQQPDVSNDA